MTTDADLLWSPSHPEKAQASLFREQVNATQGTDFKTYEELQKWSCKNRGAFWNQVWDWEGIIGDKGDGPYVDESATPRDNPTWFPNAKLNWAENQLKHAAEHPDDIAIIDTTEHMEGWTPQPRRVTQRELLDLVGRAQQGMIAAGIKKGHRVAYWGGNRLESVVTLLATSSLGAIFSSAAADFGVDGVIERLEQIKPHLLVVANGVVYNAKGHALLPLLPRLFNSLSHPPKHTVVIRHIPGEQADVDDFLSGFHDGHTKLSSWETFMRLHEDQTDNHQPKFERIGFNDPIWILFSSGTTGKPKAIVHRQGGMLLDSLREHHIQGDITRGDVFFQYTTPGWMMYQYLVAGLATGATILLYDGSPLKNPASMWNLIDAFGVNVFGTSAKYIEMISKHYPDVGKNHKLTNLRQILSTGSPLPPQLFDFVYSNVKKDVLLGSVSGGTDICSVFAGRCSALPVYRGEIQCRQLGFALDSTSANDEAGELIVRQAFPIEPVGFWPLPRESLPDGSNIAQSEVDKAKARFLESYFKDDAGNWYHGDFVKITPSRSGNGGGFVFLGRSDGVLNPSGIRFGPTDIYSVLENPAFGARGIEETLVVGLLVEDGADERVILFVKMSEGKTLDEELIKLIKSSIRSARSARHVPSRIVQVSDVPMTLTGKKIEVPIRKVINGLPVDAINPATLRNPDCLHEYVELGDTMRKEEGVTRVLLA